MNYEYTQQHQKHDLDDIETSLKRLSEREYERDTPVLVKVLKQSLDSIWESISKRSQYWENLAQFERVKDNLVTLEPKLRDAREAQRLEIEALRSAGLPL